MSEKLSTQQEKFCLNIIEGMNQGDAYKAAGYKCANDETAWACSSRLLSNAKVSKRIDELRKGAQERTELSTAHFAKRLERLAAAAERTALKEADGVEMIASKEASDVARQCSMDAAKLLGLVIDRSKVESENINYVVSDTEMTEEQWASTYSSNPGQPLN